MCLFLIPQNILDRRTYLYLHFTSHTQINLNKINCSFITNKYLGRPLASRYQIPIAWFLCQYFVESKSKCYDFITIYYLC